MDYGINGPVDGTFSKEISPPAPTLETGPSTGSIPTADALRAKYGKVYRVAATLEIDDDTEKEVEYHFKRPSAQSFDRYLKTASQGMARSLKNFLRDSVTDESRMQLEADMEEYPALSMALGEKLLALLGLAKQTNLKQL